MEKDFTAQRKKIVDVGVDWITCSSTDGILGTRFADVACGMLEEEKKRGVRPRPASFRGYTGLRGERTFYGTSRRDALCIHSGGLPLAHACDLIHAATNVSRIDLQVTIESESPDTHLGRINYLLAEQGGTKRGVKPIVQRIHNTKYGDTVSIGSRISDQYGRFYDKGIQAKSRAAGLLHRYEVEYKRDKALQIATQLVTRDDGLLAMNSTVLAWWRERGVDPLRGEIARSQIETLPQTHPDPELIRWFKEKVSKSVRTSIERHGLHETLRALGLLDVE